MNKDGSLTDIEQNWLREYRSWCKSDAPLQLKIEMAREFLLKLQKSGVPPERITK